MPKKILIIDEQEGDKILIRELLLAKGIACEFVMASSGEEGIEKARSEKPDIVLIDTGLKVLSGFETCQRIRDLPGNDFKLIIMTGVVDAVDAGKARRSGADDFCVKTSDCESIIQAVNNSLN